MAKDYSRSTPNSAGSQKTAGSASLASPPRSQHGAAQSEQQACNSPTVILVMGVQGCGKTSFVDKVIGDQCHNVKENIQHSGWSAETSRIDSFSAELDGQQYLFYDTTGCSTIEDNDPTEIFSLCQQLCKLQDVNGILYIHRISDTRIDKLGRQYLELFELLCGRSCMKNVLFLTGHWDAAEPEDGERRERELRGHFWKRMIDAGATVERLDPTMPECMQSIVERFSSFPPVVLEVKNQMVHQEKDFMDTPIGHLITERIDQEYASIYPELQRLLDVQTPNQLRTQIYKMTARFRKLQSEYSSLLDELQHYKEIQSKSIWHSFGFGSCIIN